MKKLMIALAVAAMAVCSQGSMVYWQFADAAVNNATKNPPWTYFDNAQNLTGYTAYLIAASDWDASDVATSLGKAQDSASFSTATWDTSKQQANFKTGSVKAEGLKLDVGTGAFYVVVANDDNYWASSELTGVSILEDGSIETGYTAAKVNLSNATSIKTSDMKPIGGDVPEPTSAMLLLLGVAGLALKRKQA